jgi:rod shape-determining protein MreB and related proteins
MARFAMGGPDIAIDLGTANTLVFVAGQGIVLQEPSVIAMDVDTGVVHAVGSDAKRMIGRTPANISASRPLRHGVIADFEVAEEMLRYFIRRVHRGRFSAPRVVMCAPSGITEVEQRAVDEACRSAGARQVHLIEEPLAAAIGAGVQIEEPTGQMVLDIGGGTSEVAVLSLGGIVVSRAVRVGGYEFDDAVAAHLRNEHRLAIGEGSAEEVKLRIGSAWPLVPEEEFDVRGRDLASGLPRNLTLTSGEVRSALAEPVQQVVDAVHETLEQTPPELAADIARHGILLAGGGALLRGIDERVREHTHLQTTVARFPLECVVLGAGQALDDFDRLDSGTRAFGRR